MKPFCLYLTMAILFSCAFISMAAGADDIPSDTIPLYRVQLEKMELHKATDFIVRSAPIALSDACVGLGNKTEDAVLSMPVFDGAVLGKITWRRFRNQDSFSVGGTLMGDASGHFIVTIHKGSVTLSIHDDNRGWLRVEHSNKGYVLQEMNPEAVPECGSDHIPQPFHQAPASPIHGQMSPGKDEATHIDVMVVYTTASLSRAGGIAAMEALILSAADLANLAYANSNIALTLNIVHMAEVNYVEDYELALALAKLTFKNDGVMDEVHDWRDAYDADMVSLIASGGDVAGIGWILSAIDPVMSQRAFSITVYNALGSHTFAHELGHNMGCDHDQQNITADGYRLFSYSRGWRFNAAEDGKLYRTVMSYAPGIRIAHFSNPDINYLGTPTGISIGDPDEAHCAMTVNYSAPYIAQNRPNAVEGESEGEDVPLYEGYYCEKLGSLYSNYLLRTLLPPFAIPLFNLLNPETADLNGGADPETLTFFGNGMLDCAYELGVLHQIASNSALDLSATGGVTHALVAQALNANRLQINADIGESNATIVEGVAPGLLDLAAAYITIGDAGSIDFISGLLEVINDAYYVGTLHLEAYTLLPEYLSADGDADGDGASNREEYESYGVYGPEAYITYALNPTVYPNNTGNGQVTLLGRPSVIEGFPVTLRVSLAYMIGTTTIHWYKDNEPISGATREELNFPKVKLEDAGVYKVVVTDESKALYESAPFTLEVLPESSIPISGSVVLATLALLLTLLSVSAIRPRGMTKGRSLF